ncbi:hypothetical protein LCGC14_0808110 [marine sediment metagenome]|uniref:Uncharacterized protein n=1 Tax=marine sediment metagenome TaxID=412755 RepID=A0A0F9PMI8_9ZZZZ
MENVYFHGGWFLDVAMDGYWYRPAGNYVVGELSDRSGWTFISNTEAMQLVRRLDEDGLIKPRLDERLRGEDLKITHRLLDLLTQSIKGG